MNDMDKAWIPKVIIGMAAGYGVGEVLYWLFKKLILPDEKWELLWNSFVPAGVIIGLLIVLYYYNKSKYEDDDTGSGDDS